MSKQSPDSRPGNFMDSLPREIQKNLEHMSLEAAAASVSGGSADTHIARIREYLAGRGLGHLEVSVQDGMTLIGPPGKPQPSE
jgi:hypothetical protein